MLETINWYPGHMKKTKELIAENLKLVDIVIEVIDARIPMSSRNPIIDQITKGKERMILLNKSDLADKKATDKWVDYFKNQGYYVQGINCMLGTGIKELFRSLEKLQEEKNADRLRKKPFRIMIVGVPNVGKSSLINRMTGKKSTQTGDRPGVTKGKQWLTLKNGMQLLDTPGILWPKFEDPMVGANLAFCGSIKDEIMDIADLCFQLIKVLVEDYKEDLIARYKLDEKVSDEPLELMDAIALKRGFILPGKRIDYERTGRTVLDEFRAGTIGKITLERV
ncbi:MAG: ribosome biogenesis GTPase YlqF [Anaerovoracaceae bacterium]